MSFKTELPLRPIRFPLLGEYQDCFSGLEFVDWIKANVKGLNGDEERAFVFAQELTEREGALRRLGEFGRKRLGFVGDFSRYLFHLQATVSTHQLKRTSNLRIKYEVFYSIEYH